MAAAAIVVAGVAPATAGGFETRLDRRLGFLFELRRLAPLELGELERAVAAELGSGRADALLIGESHGDPVEFAAARRLVAAALGAGRPVSTLLEEDSLGQSFALDPLLSSAGVRYSVFPDLLSPAQGVRAARAEAPGAIVLSYTGHAHASDRLRDYWLSELEFERIPGRPDRRRVLTTVEEAFGQAGGRPLVAAMMREEAALRQAQSLFLRELPGARGRRIAELRADLDRLVELWGKRFTRLPARPAGLFFVRDPRRAGVYFGLSPSDGLPRELLAARWALSSPEAAEFAGDGRIVGVEALPAAVEGRSERRVSVRFADGRVWEAVATSELGD